MHGLTWQPDCHDNFNHVSENLVFLSVICLFFENSFLENKILYMFLYMLCVCERLKVYTPHMYTWEIINNKQPCVPGGWLIKAEEVILFIKSFYTVT